jgi:tripartite-type tricarboxylate transporter receptor subunit TctC
MSSRNKLTKRQVLAGMAALSAPLVLPRAGLAQADYPNRPIRVVVPFPPGGGADTTARILFQKLSDLFKQQFVIDNRGGAGGSIGAAVVAKSPADGYTLLHDGTGHAINPSLYTNLTYDTGKDFQAVFLASLVTNFLLVNNAVPVKSVSDIVALGKATPAGLDWASSGNGTVQHLALEMFKQRTGIAVNHVPYRGGGPALNDLMGGQVKFFFSNGASSVGHVRGGTLRAVAHTARERLKSLPDIPIVAETLPGFEAYEFNAVFAPTGTPAAIVQKLNTGLNEVIRQPDIVQRMNELNLEFKENSADECRTFINAEIARWAEVIRQGNIKLG